MPPCRCRRPRAMSTGPPRPVSVRARRHPAHIAIPMSLAAPPCFHLGHTRHHITTPERHTTGDVWCVPWCVCMRECLPRARHAAPPHCTAPLALQSASLAHSLSRVRPHEQCSACKSVDAGGQSPPNGGLGCASAHARPARLRARLPATHRPFERDEPGAAARIHPPHISHPHRPTHRRASAAPHLSRPFLRRRHPAGRRRPAPPHHHAHSYEGGASPVPACSSCRRSTASRCAASV